MKLPKSLLSLFFNAFFFQDLEEMNKRLKEMEEEAYAL
jgi:hypothetical protein